MYSTVFFVGKRVYLYSEECEWAFYVRVVMYITMAGDSEQQMNKSLFSGKHHSQLLG